MNSQQHLEISEGERDLLIQVMTDVLEERAFFSVGEMTTITGWSAEAAEQFHEALRSGQTSLDRDEQNFVRDAIYAWSVSARKGRVVASVADVEAAGRLDGRCRAAMRGTE